MISLCRLTVTILYPARAVLDSSAHMAMGTRLLVWSGNKMPLSHGTLFTFPDQQTDLDVFINDDLARLTFVFTDDGGMPRADYSVKPAVPSDKPNDRGLPPTVVLRFSNLRAVGQVFADGPLRVGTVGGHSLWIAYEVTRSISNVKNTHKITYTLWEGPRTEDRSLLPEPAPRG